MHHNLLYATLHPGIALRRKIRYHDMIKSMPTRALEG